MSELNNRVINVFEDLIKLNQKNIEKLESDIERESQENSENKETENNKLQGFVQL